MMTTFYSVTRIGGEMSTERTTASMIRRGLGVLRVCEEEWKKAGRIYRVRKM